VRDFLAELPPDTIIVTGGAAGPDTWAAEIGRERGLTVIEHLPDLAGVRNRGEATRRYYARNQRIADDCDRMVALVAPDRKGGTEDSIRRAIALGKPVTIL
jgi:hypothetical protein